MKYEKYRQNTHHLTALNHLTMTHCTDGDICGRIYHAYQWLMFPDILSFFPVIHMFMEILNIYSGYDFYILYFIFILEHCFRRKENTLSF